MRGQNSPPPLNNMLIGGKTSTISPWGVKIRHPLWTICWLGEKHQLYLHEGSKFATPYEQYVDWGKNINYISMRGQNSPPPLNNMLIGGKTSTISPWGIKIRHPLWTICWLGEKHQLYLHEGSKFATPSEQYFGCGKTINYISMRDQNSPPPMNNKLVGVVTSTLSSWGIKIRHPLWTICWLGEKHQLYLHEGSKFATPSEQYVDWGKNINYISMRDQNSPPPMNNKLVGVVTSTLSSWGIKIRHPLWTICWLGEKHQLYLHEGSKFATPSEQYVDWAKNINYISMRDQNSPPPMNNKLVGVVTSTLSSWGIKIRHPLWTICWLGEKHQLYLHEGSKFATPSEQYVDWGKNINYISMRGQNSPPPLNNMLIGGKTSTISPWGVKIRHPLWTICWLGEKHQLYLHEGSKFATPYEQYVDWGKNINYISMRGQNSPPPLNNMLIGGKTSTISPWGIKIRHPLWTICWLGEKHQLYLHEGSKFATPSEQYVDCGKNINYIFMRDQNSPPPMNNKLVGVVTSTLSSWGIKIRHPLWTICWLGEKHQLYLHEGSKFATPSEQYVDWGKNINYISMRDQNSPPPMNNKLVGVVTSTLSSWGIKIRHPLWTICWLGEKHQLYLHEGSKFATPSEQYVDWGKNINYISMRDQNSPPPMNNKLVGVVTSTLSSWGIKIRHPLWTICWLGEKHQLYLHEGSKFATPSEQYVETICWLGEKHQLYLHEGSKFASLLWTINWLG